MRNSKTKLVLRNNLPFIVFADEVQNTDIVLDKTNDFVKYPRYETSALLRQLYHIIDNPNKLLAYEVKELYVIFRMIHKPNGVAAYKYYASHNKKRIFYKYDTELDAVDSFVDFDFESIFYNPEVTIKEIQESLKKLKIEYNEEYVNTLFGIFKKLSATGVQAYSRHSFVNINSKSTIKIIIDFLEKFDVSTLYEVIEYSQAKDISEYFYRKTSKRKQVFNTILFYQKYRYIDVAVAYVMNSYELSFELAKKVVEVFNHYPPKDKLKLHLLKKVTFDKLKYGLRVYEAVGFALGKAPKFSVFEIGQLPIGREFEEHAIHLYVNYADQIDTFYTYEKLVSRPYYPVSDITFKLLEKMPDMLNYIDLGFTELELLKYYEKTTQNCNLEALLQTIRDFRTIGDTSFEEGLNNSTETPEL